MTIPLWRNVRYADSPYATYGRLFRPNGSQFGVILELPWVDVDGNGKRDTGKSRIVPGIYDVIFRNSPKRGYVVPWLCGVPDVTLAGFPDEPTATTCQIHRAAFPSDLLGCLGIGEKFEVRDDPHAHAKKLAMRGSPEAFARFMAETLGAGYQRIRVQIEDAFEQKAAA